MSIQVLVIPLVREETEAVPNSVQNISQKEHSRVLRY